MKPEKKLYQKFKKNTPLIQHTRIETYINFGVPEQLNVVLEKVLSGVGIVWNKTKALQIENKGYN